MQVNEERQLVGQVLINSVHGVRPVKLLKMIVWRGGNSIRPRVPSRAAYKAERGIDLLALLIDGRRNDHLYHRNVIAGYRLRGQTMVRHLGDKYFERAIVDFGRWRISRALLLR
jgi:hypothetical protein